MTELKKTFYRTAYPWIIWGISAGFIFYKYLLQVSPSVMTGDLMRAFQINAGWLGNLSACFFYAYLIMQIPVGILLDRYSPRRLTTVAILVCSFSTLLFAENTSFLSASITRAFMGFGSAFAAISCFQLAAMWFPPKRFALVSGMFMTAGMFGAIGGQLPLSLMVQSGGWRSAMHTVGLVGLGLAALYFLIVRDKVTNKPTPLNKPQPKAPFFANLWHVVTNPQAIWLSVYSGLAFAPVTVFGGLWGVPFLSSAYQLSADDAAIVVSFVFVGFAFGAPFLGWLSDHIGRRKPILVYGTLAALIGLSIVIYGNALSYWTLASLLFIFGFGASGYFTSFAVIREHFSLTLVATALGVMNTFDSLCEALFEPLIGAVLDMTWHGDLLNGVRQMSPHGYHIALSFLPISMLFALISLYFINETYCRGFESTCHASHNDELLTF